ncbi:MAG TPA: GTPase ObgE [Firmicutes bacterium]|nr:GTPase ObgE [Bacillota bacterium]
MFIDTAQVYLKAGDGGDGVVRYRREKYIPAGGPAGGDGGRGGSIFFLVDSGLSTLQSFRYRRKFVAQSGERGGSKRQAGSDGEDLVIKVPPGTLVKEPKSGEILLDLTVPGQKVLILPGGRGGRGNARFKTATRQAPAFAERGEPGEGILLDLELKLLADVGLVGYPNAGKSTLLSVVSSARPKVASYPFTTLTPNLGVVNLEEGASFVVADIPGLIEGAHKGVGLGTGFLKHIERTRLILHLVDAAGVDGRDPVADYHKINEELEFYSGKLGACPQIVVANKADLPAAKDNIERLKGAAAQDGREFFVISAATTDGIEALMARVGRLVLELKQADPPAELVEKLVFPREKPAPVEDYQVIQENGDYTVKGRGLDRLMRRLDLQNPEAISYLQNLFEKIGLYAALAEMNVPAGATVRVGELEFEYME